MKNLLIASMILASSVTANAGNVAYVPPQATTLEEPARMGGSGAWLIPLVIVTVVALALTKAEENNPCHAQASGPLGFIADC